MTLRVAVLGCGPAGMLAAHAAARTGAQVDIYSEQVEPSRIGGAQYLHRSIPGLTMEDPDAVLRIVKVGEPDGYARKVYGRSSAETSWYQFDGYLDAWNMHEVYSRLWQFYGECLVQQRVTPDESLRISESYDWVFSAIPHHSLCTNAMHVHAHQPVYITAEALATGHNTIVYNGDDGDHWYRASEIFGTPSVEYPEHSELVPLGAKRITKPLWTNCTCVTRENIVCVGRYGEWRKGVLIHHAYEKVMGLLG